MDSSSAPSIFVLLWPLLKLFLVVLAFAIVFGLLIGIFTYGRPIRKVKNASGMDAAFEIGLMLSHALIDLILGRSRKGRGGSEGWLDDQKLLAMMRGMSPPDFERFIAEMFEALGYKTEVVGGKSDGGIDIEMTKDDRRHVVQCKKYMTQKVRPTEVRDFFGAMGGSATDGKGFFVTTNIFTAEAELFAEDKPIELIDGPDLVRLVRQSGVLGAAATKPENANPANKETCPDCGGTLVARTNHKDNTRFLGCSNFPKCRYTKSI